MNENQDSNMTASIGREEVKGLRDVDLLQWGDALRAVNAEALASGAMGTAAMGTASAPTGVIWKWGRCGFCGSLPSDAKDGMICSECAPRYAAHGMLS